MRIGTKDFTHTYPDVLGRHRQLCRNRAIHGSKKGSVANFVPNSGVALKDSISMVLCWITASPDETASTWAFVSLRMRASSDSASRSISCEHYQSTTPPEVSFDTCRT
ncbi:unnamed protein product [Linum trigynum]|uniref:Uncharacterized protein n=1 Tax=Linum trigynum TaxID=586398 RepID=A0AAV2GRT0_9ROSI